MKGDLSVAGYADTNGYQRSYDANKASTNGITDKALSRPMSMRELAQAELRGETIPVSEEQLIKSIEKAMKAVHGPYTYLEFSVHEATRRISVKVHDKETNEVIREIPPEKTLDFVAKLWEMAGILVDERR